MDRRVTRRTCRTRSGPGSGREAGRTRGFSLIELVVATAVLAVLTAGVTISAVSRPGAGDAAVFAARWDMAQAAARLSRVRRGLDISSQALTPMAWHPATATTPARWQEAGRPRRWRRPVRFDTRGVVAQGQPEVVILPDGRSTAFSVAFRGGGRCESDGWTGLRCSDE